MTNEASLEGWGGGRDDAKSGFHFLYLALVSVRTNGSTSQFLLHVDTMKIVTLAVLAVVFAVACAAPAKIGSGVNLAGMDFGQDRPWPGTYDTDYTLPTTAEVRSLNTFTRFPNIRATLFLVLVHAMLL